MAKYFININGELNEIGKGNSAYDIAVYNGFEGTEQEWLESINGKDGSTVSINPEDQHWYLDGEDTGIVAAANDGITPHIDETTKHWFIGNTDTQILAEGKDGIDGKDGKSIKSIEKDKNNNIIVTFSDNTNENIGELNIDISADFLTSNGFGNLRYYNSHFQYYDNDNSTWIDTSATPENVYIVQMIPQTMQKIYGIYDIELKRNKIRWVEPNDTVIDGQVVCVVEKVVIRRKLGGEPKNMTDGELVMEVNKNQFGSYKDVWYIDEEITPNDSEEWYYKAFPVSTSEFVNESSANSVVVKAKDYYLFGFVLDQNESDPESMITYIEDNKGFKSAYMNYNSDKFDYGDFEEFWFIRDVKPCMLKYDGTVGYELDKNDYSKKITGEDSDISNEDYDGNVMIGIPKTYWKIVDNGDNTANVYISNKKLDKDFVCWSHIDNNGDEIDYCYMPAYNGYNDGVRLRELSDKTPIHSQDASTEISLAKANNIDDNIIWYTEVFSDRMLINLLLLLIGKSTNTQEVFGNGHCEGGGSAANLLQTGTLNDKGLFYGTNVNSKAVKVFGMEHWWGGQWRRIAGWINDRGTQKIKLTYGQSDGSTVNGYNVDGTDYISVGCTPSGTSGGYISKMAFTEYGMIPTISTGSSTTYYTDGLYFNNSQINYAYVGGDSRADFLVGALCIDLSSYIISNAWHAGVAISCKPLSQK